MKITIEGSIEDLAPALRALLGSTSISVANIEPVEPRVEAPAETPTLDVVAAHEDVVDEKVIETPIIPASPKLTILQQVFEHIAANPGKTTAEITETMGLRISQTKSAISDLQQTKQIERQTNEHGQLLRPARWSKLKDKTPIKYADILLSFIRENPNSTSSIIARSTNVPYDRVTSIMNALKSSQKVLAQGKGGIGDPYRYSTT